MLIVTAVNPGITVVEFMTLNFAEVVTFERVPCFSFLSHFTAHSNMHRMQTSLTNHVACTIYS